MEVKDYLKVIRARWWLMVLTMLIVLAVFQAVSHSQKPTYQGEAEVIVSGQNAAATIVSTPRQQTPVSQADVLTQAQVIQSPRIAAQVIRTLHLKTTPDSLLKRVTASTDGQTNIVTIDALDESSVRAAELANAFAKAYVDWSLEGQTASLKAAEDDVVARLSQAQQQIAALTPAPNKTALGEKAARLEAAHALYASLSDKLEQLRINEQLATGSGSVLASAVPEPVPLSPNPVRNAGLGLAVGLALGLGAVFLAEQLDVRIRSSEEAEEIYGVRVLGSIPVEKFKKEDARRLTLGQNPGSSAAEAYRGLRNSLNFLNSRDDVKTVLVTSAAPSEGKSTVAANLAAGLSQAGRTVVLLNCDFHRPATANFFDVNDEIGLADVLTGTHDLSAALQQPEGFDRLCVVTAGQRPPNPSELLGSSKMEQLVADVRETVDWVIVDAPPLLAVADAAAVARSVDGVLVVTHVGVSTRNGARTARDQLDNVGARIIGIVVRGRKSDAAVGRAYSYSHYTSS